MAKNNTAEKTKMKDVGVHARALLVSVTVSSWAARRLDKRVTDEVHQEHGASKQAGRYSKRLFANNAPSHRAAMAASGAVRRTHYRNTLPWSDEGWRLLPSANYFEYTEAIREIREQQQEALEEFLAEYPELVKKAKADLGDLWRAEDYPEPAYIRSRFGVQVNYRPVPASGDFRVDLPADQVDEITRAVEESVREATDAAMKDAWARLYRVVRRAHERLTARLEAEDSDDEDAKLPPLHASVVENIRSMVDVLRRLNVTGDPALEAMMDRAEQEVAQYDIKDLRQSTPAREETAAAAAKILADMTSIYGDLAATGDEDEEDS